MKKEPVKFSKEGLVAFIIGSAFTSLLMFSVSVTSYILLFASILIGIVFLIKYKPYKGGWTRKWMGEPQREATVGLMVGLCAGSINLVLNYESQSYFSTAISVIALAIGVILYAVYFSEYYQWPKSHYNKDDLDN